MAEEEIKNIGEAEDDTLAEDALIQEVLGFEDELEVEKPEEEKKEIIVKKDDTIPTTKNETEELRNLDRKINRRVDARVDRLERQLEKKIIAEREAYVGAIATVNDRIQEALDNNNVKAYAQATEAKATLEKKKEELDGDLKIIKEEPKETEETTEKKTIEDIKIDEAANRWLQANEKLVKRIDADPGLSAIAKGISAKLLKNGYAGKPQIELLAEVKRRILEEVPEEFSDIVTKDEIPSVSGGKMDISNNGASSGSGKNYTMNDVPARDRQILKNYITAKVYKDEKEAVTKYFQRKLKEKQNG